MRLILLLSLATVIFGFKKDVHWKKLTNDSIRGLARFDSTDYAFPVADNLVWCRKKIVVLPLTPGETDYGPIIEQKLAALYASGGGTLRFTAGLYYIKTQFSIPSFTCLQGAGMHKTTLKVHPEAPPFPKAGMMRTRHTTRVSIFDLTQDGNRHKLPGEPQNRFGIYTHMANYVWMKNVRIVDNKWYGFDPHGANTAWSYYLVMEDCYSSGNGKDGFTIDQYYYVSMLNSVAVNNDRHGINVVSGSRYVLVKGNLVKDNALCSLVMQNNEFGTQSVRFVNNVGVGHGLAGICIRNSFDVQAMGNKIYTAKPGASMFQLHAAAGVKLVNNEWVRTPTSGKLFSGYGENYYDVWKNTYLDYTPAIGARYTAYFANIEKPPAALVDLKSNTYGKAVANNKVPVPPKRLVEKKGNPDNVAKSLTLKKRERTHRQFEDPKGNNPADSDAKCENGIRNGIYCCAAKCGKCVESNCFNGGDGACCPSAIRKDASSCDTFSAPCLMSRKYTASGRLYGPAKMQTNGIFPENADVKTGKVPAAAQPIKQTPPKSSMPQDPIAPPNAPVPAPQKPVESQPPMVPAKPQTPATPTTEPMEKEPAMEKKPVMPVNEPMEKKPAMEKKPVMPVNEPMEKKPAMEKKPVMEKNEPSAKDDDDDDEMKELSTKKGAVGGPDPTCAAGVRNGSTCCLKSCGQCGGSGCSKRPGGKMCCASAIRLTGKMCKDHSAPCILKM